MRRLHLAGEKLFVDYSGATVPIVNPDTGEISCAEIFVATLGASNYTFASASWTQRKADWIDAHVQAFECSLAACRKLSFPTSAQCC